MNRDAPECIQFSWIVLFTTSFTVNCVIVLKVILLAVSRAIWPLKPDPSKRKRRPAADTAEFMHIHREQLASISAESLISLAVFVCGFYALLNGAVADPFTRSGNQSCHLVIVITVLSSISIGRLAVTLGSTLLHPNAISILEARRIFEDMFSFVTNVILLSNNEAFLTRALLCIMSIDNYLYDFENLIIKDKTGDLRNLVIKLKVVRCFLALAFRGAVPLACYIVSLVAFRRDVFDMQALSIAGVAGSAVFYLLDNTFVIVYSARDMWLAYSRQHVERSSPLNNKLPDNRRRATIVFEKNDIANPLLRARNSTKTVSRSLHSLPVHTRTGLRKTRTKYKTTRKKLVIASNKILDTIEEGSEASD